MKRPSKQTISKLVVVAIVDAIFFGLTNPNSVKAIFLVVGFGLVILNAYFIIEGLLGLVTWYGIHLHNTRRLTYLLSGLVAVLLALESLGQLNFKEALIIMPFFLLLYVYLSYNRQRG